MNVKRAILSNGIYTWNTDVTTEEWRMILMDDILMRKEYKEILYSFYLRTGHRATCREIAKQRGCSASSIRRAMEGLGKAVQYELDRFKVIGSDKQPTYWVIPMLGRLKDKALEWVIRPELVEAMEYLFEDGNPAHPRKNISRSSVKQSISYAEQEGKGFTLQEGIDLMQLSKNVIFTGVIGAGKTYLARQIAESIHADMEVVRFHPGYGYGDFMESVQTSNVGRGGLEENEEVKDGVFKAFCKRALKNLLDSQKSKEELSEELRLNRGFRIFKEEIRNTIFESGEFVLRDADGEEFASIIDLNANGFITESPNGRIVEVPWKDMLVIYKTYALYRDISWNIFTVEEKLSISQYHRYYLLFLKAFDQFMQQSQIEVEAETVTRKNYVFLIDEINRANISQVFGEALYAIEPRHRGEIGKVTTKYTYLLPEHDLFSAGFFVPENVYIVGTMNDIDSDEKMMDLSTIRQFTWQRIGATDRMTMWDGVIDTYREEAFRRMSALNDKIDTIEGLNELYHIGPAYFLKLKDFNGDFNALWEKYMRGVLMQYFLDKPNYIEILEELKFAYDSGGKSILV